MGIFILSHQRLNYSISRGLSVRVIHSFPRLLNVLFPPHVYKHREDFFVELDESESAEQASTLKGEARAGCEKLNSGEINNNADV